MKIWTFILALLIVASCKDQAKFGDFDFLDIESDSLLTAVMSYPKQYEVQIIYTQINRGENGKISFVNKQFNVDSNTYYYPASTVKMPVAFLALEKLNELYDKNIEVDYNTSLQIDAPRNPPQSPVIADSTAIDKFPSIGHYVHKLFLVSDNDAFNRLYEFVGPEEINQKLREKGIFGNSRIVHRVGISGFDPEENRHTNPFRFYEDKRLVHEQPAAYMEEKDFGSLANTMKGKAFINEDGKLVEGPFDFSEKNFVSLPELQKSMMGVFFPEQMGAAKYNLRAEDYDLLYRSMSMLPSESKAPIYDKEHHWDSYVKFLMFGDDKNDLPKHIRIFNKVGLAYGYLTDCAYIVDFKNKVDFFLTATIHVNENQTFNDGKYEYDEIGIPFLTKLGKKIYEYELTRERDVEADLERFVVTYD